MKKNVFDHNNNFAMETYKGKMANGMMSWRCIRNNDDDGGDADNDDNDHDENEDDNNDDDDHDNKDEDNDHDESKHDNENNNNEDGDDGNFDDDDGGNDKRCYFCFFFSLLLLLLLLFWMLKGKSLNFDGLASDTERRIGRRSRAKQFFLSSFLLQLTVRRHFGWQGCSGRRLFVFFHELQKPTVRLFFRVDSRARAYVRAGLPAVWRRSFDLRAQPPPTLST